MPTCEVCGTAIKGPVNRVEIDGAIVGTCATCARMGRPVGGPSRPRLAPRLSPAFVPFRGYPSPRPAPEPEFELDSEYHLKVRQARERMGISQEELGRIINEKPSVVRLVESGKLRPDGLLTRKLMHYMKLDLLARTAEFEGPG